MEKIPFNIKYRPQIESGEYKVETEDGFPATILDWSFRKGSGQPYLCVKITRDGEDGAFLYAKDGRRSAIECVKDNDLFIITPELAESENKKMINELQGFLSSFGAHYFGSGEWHKFDDWLERQKEQKPVEWSEEDENMAYFVNQFLGYHENTDPTAKSCKKWFNNRLKFFRPRSKEEWTINNAKPGDILYISNTASNKIFIFKGIRNDEHGSVECFCCYDSEDGFLKGEEEFIGWKTDKYRLATPEQCVELGRIMGRAGYVFYFETNQLRKLNRPHWKPSEEQSDVNLEKEIEKYYYDNFAFISSAHIPTKDILSDIAVHFYELGLNERKEE